MIQSVKVFVENNFAYAGLSCYLLGSGPRGEPLLAKRVEYVETSLLEVSHEPTFQLSRDEGQQLMDALWVVGLRPTEGMGSAGALAATQDHLKTLKEVNNKLFALLENEPIEGVGVTEVAR